MKHPLQPIALDERGCPRFVKNAIVEYLLDSHPTADLNTIARMSFSDEDRRQFAQLLGYSVGGYCDLSYVSGDEIAVADAAAKALGTKTEESIRLEVLEATLKAVRDGLRGPVADLFNIHPDDLS